MKGDFSRISFDPTKHFSQVLLQQGRVTLDADPNEQSAILLHYLRTLARDLIGPYGGPADAQGFRLALSADGKSLRIGEGRYYVDGILCESSGHDYANQPDWQPQPPDSKGTSGDLVLLQLRQPEEDTVLFLYLDVWERHITWIEEAHIREVALNGPDTCTRSKVIWQVKPLELVALRDDLTQRKQVLDALFAKGGSKDQRLKQRSDLLQQALDRLEDDEQVSCGAPLIALDADIPPQLAARLDPGRQIKDPCELAPDALYRGAENQLYRVEIHHAGNASGATFKWSRDNGSVATPWLGLDGDTLQVTSSRGFDIGDWVEIADDRSDLAGDCGLLVRVLDVSPGQLRILHPPVPQGLPDFTTLKHPKIRRWNQRDNDDVQLKGGAIPVVESEPGKMQWIDLENGVQICFAANANYRSGDYWLIPARTATGGIEWPAVNDEATLQPPRGVEHHYAPLGWLRWNPNNDGDGEFEFESCLCTLNPTNSCALLTGGQRQGQAKPLATDGSGSGGSMPASGGGAREKTGKRGKGG